MFPYAHCLWKSIFCLQNGLKVKISIFTFFVTFLCVYLRAQRIRKFKLRHVCMHWVLNCLLNILIPISIILDEKQAR